jgi:UDP-N-acetylmuramoylalanine--D-glutamate ligase
MSADTPPRPLAFRNQPWLVVGLGVSGLSAARYLHRAGARLTVTDSRSEPPGATALADTAPGAHVAFGGLAAVHPLPDYAGAVLSPGVDPREPFVERLRAAGVSVMGDVELFARAVSTPVVGITGSNGKSTVTTLVGEMARAAGLRVAVGGNLGTPALDLIAPDVRLYVLELSSFQLETTFSLRCAAAAVLNLSEDHLDRHGSMAAYAAAKARILRGATAAVLNADDPAVAAMATEPTSRRRYFTLRASGAEVYGFDPDAQTLCRPGGGARIPVASLRIAGLHNLANALAAMALADAVGIPAEAQAQALARFEGLPHRCRLVRELRGVRYYNDSKGTNVGAALAAIRGLPGPLHWLGGGQGKGQDFSPLGPALADREGRAYVFGADAQRLAAELEPCVPVRSFATLDAALQAAHRAAVAPATVLLSPACASLDQFSNYEARGAHFEALVEALS